MTQILQREGVRHPLKRRELTVVEVTDITAQLRRIKFSSPELADFVAPGPADHVKMFFPDPETGELVLPEIGPDGMRVADAKQPIARDYTPLNYYQNAAGDFILEVDFVLHGDDGPAAVWAARAQVGDQLSIGGPRGSHLIPTGLTELVLVADETALPASRRWLEGVGTAIPVTGLFFVENDEVAEYLRDCDGPNRNFSWFSGNDQAAQLEAALRKVVVTPSTFFFLAGEAGTLVPLRRYLRRELGLSADQVDVQGYWKRGVVNLDHHAPIDPSDPD